MSHYIVDASIVVQLVVADRYTDEAKALFKGIEDGDTINVPEFCILECANVLWKQVRFRGVAQSEVDRLLDVLLALDIVVMTVHDLLPRALEIGLKHQLAVYDSVYIALAEKLEHPLITDDEKQANAAIAEGVRLKPITDFAPEE